MGIIENKLRSRKQEINQIDQKVSSEQITPTQNERRNINELIQRISSQFRKELTDTTVDRKELEEKIKKCIQSEIEKFPASYEEKRRLEKLAIANIIGLGPIQPLLGNPEITEIVVQRYDNIVVDSLRAVIII